MKTEKTIAEDYIVSFNDFILKRLNENIEEILNKDSLKKVWEPMWNKFTEIERKDWIINISKNIAKEKALIDLGNDANLMKHHMSSLRIETKINEYIEKVSSIAIDFYYTHFESLNEDKIFNDYKAEIDKVLSKETVGQKEETNYIKICNTPDVFKSIGLEDKDITIKRSKIRICNLPKEEGGHNITKEIYYKLPELFQNPAYILKSKTEAKSVVAILNEIDDEKMPILVAIKPDEKGIYEFQTIDTNLLKSIYGRDKFENFINDNEENLLFKDEKQIAELNEKISKHDDLELK